MPLRSVSVVVTPGTSACKAATMLADSASLKAEDEEASDVPPVSEDLRLLTPMSRPRAEKIDPSKPLTSPSRLLTSDEIEEMSLRTALASRVLSGREDVSVEARRRRKEVLNFILGICRWYW